MPDTTRESDRILREAKTSLAVQRDGGTHRPGKKHRTRVGGPQAQENLVKRVKGAGG